MLAKEGDASSLQPQVGGDSHLVMLVSHATQVIPLALACHTSSANCECPQAIDSPKFDVPLPRPTRTIENVVTLSSAIPKAQ
jgi:hypothetical protein